MAGTVAVTADLAGRYTVFAVSLQRLLMPAGTQVAWQLGSDVAVNRNRAVSKMHGEWIWFVDDDHAFAPDLLLRLLHHNVDVVTPICMRRYGNFQPVPVIGEDTIDLRDYGPTDLIRVDRAGTAGMLIRKSVFDRIEEPWFEMAIGRSDDFIFCEKLEKAGIPIHVDLEARLGHVTTAIVWPTHLDDGWSTGFQFADGFEVQVDTTREPREDDRPVTATQ